MSPGLPRNWSHHLVIAASLAALYPVVSLLSHSRLLTWVGIVGLAGLAFVLWRKRDRLRAAFCLPLIYIPALAAFRFQSEEPSSVGSTIALAVFALMCVAGLLVNTFWDPYEDDLAEQEELSTFRE